MWIFHCYISSLESQNGLPIFPILENSAKNLWNHHLDQSITFHVRIVGKGFKHIVLDGDFMCDRFHEKISWEKSSSTKQIQVGEVNLLRKNTWSLRERQ